MLSFKITLDAEKLPDLTPGKISKLTRSVASRVRTAVVRVTPRDSGAARKSWTPVRKVDGGYSFGSDLVYITALEFGSEPGKRPWPSPGPKTVYHKGKIYSSQAPGGMFETADADAIAQKVAEELFRKIVGE